MNDNIIFHETDDDDDSLEVRSVDSLISDRVEPVLMACSKWSGGGLGVQVRLTRGSVERLRDALNGWLGEDASTKSVKSDTSHRCPECRHYTDNHDKSGCYVAVHTRPGPTDCGCTLAFGQKSIEPAGPCCEHLDQYHGVVGCVYEHPDGNFCSCTERRIRA